jgi:hypothetical protein
MNTDRFATCYPHVVRLGGGCKNDPNIYKLCEDWREWEPEKIIRTMPKKNFKFGWQKRKNKLNHSKPITLNQRKPIRAGNHE